MSAIIKSESTHAIGRTPGLIAAEINNIKEQTKKMVLYNSIEIGRRLIEAKQVVPHGEWGIWLQSSVDYSKSTANNLMRIFEEYGADQITLLDDNAKSQALGNLSYTQALALLGIPSEERETFVENNDIENMSTRELQKAIKEKETLEKKLKEAENKALKDKEEKEKLKKEIKDIQEKNKEALVNKEVEIENFKIHIEDIKKKLEKAQNAGSLEEVEKLQEELKNKENELSDTHKKVEELQEELKKPIDVITAEPEVIEKVPEEIEKELQDLRQKVKQQPNETAIKFKVQFEKTVAEIKCLLTSLDEFGDEEEHEKYKNAVKGLMNKMIESL